MAFVSKLERNKYFEKYEVTIPYANYSDTLDIETVIEQWESSYGTKHLGWAAPYYLDMIRVHATLPRQDVQAVLSELFYKINHTFAEYRSEDCTGKYIYSLDTLVFVIMIATIYGNTTAKSIVEFYREHFLELYVIIPHLPDYTHKLSETTVSTAICCLNKENVRRFFIENFACIKAAIEGYLKETLAFDGQAINASYKKGESNRKYKGSDITTLFNCTRYRTVCYKHEALKNHEKDAFVFNIEHYCNTFIEGTLIMCDALNTKPIVTDIILKNGADYLMPVKANGNAEILEHLTDVTSKPHDVFTTHHDVTKDHGRIDERYIEILDPKKVLGKRMSFSHKHVRTIVKYTKHTQYVTAGVVTNETTTTRFYISSLPLDENVLAQVIESISVYWNIEAHHAVLDAPELFNQDHLHACNTTTLENHAGLNKIAHNFLSYMRDRLQAESTRPKSYTYTFKEALKFIQGLSVIDFLPYLADYWLDELDKDIKENN